MYRIVSRFKESIYSYSSCERGKKETNLLNPLKVGEKSMCKWGCSQHVLSVWVVPTIGWSTSPGFVLDIFKQCSWISILSSPKFWGISWNISVIHAVPCLWIVLHTFLENRQWAHVKVILLLYFGILRHVSERRDRIDRILEPTTEPTWPACVASSKACFKLNRVESLWSAALWTSKRFKTYIKLQ